MLHGSRISAPALCQGAKLSRDPLYYYMSRTGRSPDAIPPALGRQPSRLTGWFRELHAPLKRYIQRHKRLATADLDDVAQEVFLRLLRYDREQLIEEPRAYLFRIAANVVSEWSLRARERHAHDADWLDDLATEQDLAGDIEAGERRSEVRLAVSALPPRSREVLRLHFGEGLTRNEIATALQISPRMVKRDCAEAFSLLRNRLTPGDFGPTSRTSRAQRGRDD